MPFGNIFTEVLQTLCDIYDQSILGLQTSIISLMALGSGVRAEYCTEVKKKKKEEEEEEEKCTDFI